MALWICLRLPSLQFRAWIPCTPSTHFIVIFCFICHCVEKRTKLNKKRQGYSHDFLKKQDSNSDHLSRRHIQKDFVPAYITGSLHFKSFHPEREDYLSARVIFSLLQWNDCWWKEAGNCQSKILQNSIAKFCWMKRKEVLSDVPHFQSKFKCDFDCVIKYCKKWKLNTTHCLGL